MDTGHWKLSKELENILEKIPEGSLGFVYIITNKTNNKKYVGKKLLINKKKRKPLKGRVNARRYTVESDWKEYTGSSPKLNLDIEKLGKENFEFEIISFQPSKLMLAYYETKEIVDRNAIFSSDYYNEVLNLRIRHQK